MHAIVSGVHLLQLAYHASSRLHSLVNKAPCIQLNLQQQEMHIHLRDLRPSGLSRLLSERSMPEAARLSPRVRAPSDCSRLATADANRFSPPRLVTTSLYMGQLVCTKMHTCQLRHWTEALLKSVFKHGTGPAAKIAGMRFQHMT